MLENPYTLNLKSFSTHTRIIKIIGNNKTVLDVGCNDGYIGRSADPSNEFYGLDYLKEAVFKAKRTYKDAKEYDLNELTPLEWHKKFDVIVFADVLEHLVDPGNCLEFFVKNYLVKNGGVIISLPNVANWQVRLKLLLGRFNYTETGILDKTHLHFYTYHTAQLLAKKANLKIVKTEAGTSYLGLLTKIIPKSKSLFASSIIIYATAK